MEPHGESHVETYNAYMRRQQQTLHIYKYKLPLTWHHFC